MKNNEYIKSITDEQLITEYKQSIIELNPLLDSVLNEKPADKVSDSIEYSYYSLYVNEIIARHIYNKIQDIHNLVIYKFAQTLSDEKLRRYYNMYLMASNSYYRVSNGQTIISIHIMMQNLCDIYKNEIYRRKQNINQK